MLFINKKQALIGLLKVTYIQKINMIYNTEPLWNKTRFTFLSKINMSIVKEGKKRMVNWRVWYYLYLTLQSTIVSENSIRATKNYNKLWCLTNYILICNIALHIVIALLFRSDICSFFASLLALFHCFFSVLISL